MNSNKISIGDVLDESFNLFKKVTLSSSIAFLIYSICTAIFVFSAFFFIFGVSFQDMMDVAQDNPEYLEAFFAESISSSTSIVSSLIFLGISAVLSIIVTGILKLCDEVSHGNEANVGDLFHYFSTGKFAQLFIYFLVVGLLLFAIDYLLSLTLGSLGSFVNLIITIIVYVALYLAVPIIVFKDKSWIEAITLSMNVVFSNFWVFFALNILGFIGGIIGVFFCGIGFLFTMAFYYTTQYAAFKAALGTDSLSPIDEIGTDSTYSN